MESMELHSTTYHEHARVVDKHIYTRHCSSQRCRKSSHGLRRTNVKGGQKPHVGDTIRRQRRYRSLSPILVTGSENNVRSWPCNCDLSAHLEPDTFVATSNNHYLPCTS